MFGCIGVSIGVIRNHITVATGIWTQVTVIAVLLSLFLGSEQETQEYIPIELVTEADGATYSG